MLWDFHHAVFLKHRVIREHAVDATAERTGMDVGRRLAAEPALEKATRDTIPDLDTGDTRSDRDHLARTIRQRNDVFLDRHAISAPHDAEVAEIERTGFDLHQHLAIGRLGIRPFDLLQGVDTGPAFGQLIGTHK